MPESSKPALPSPPSRRLTDGSHPATSVIASGIHLKGDVTGDGSLDVAGTVDGNCAVSGLCRVRHGARVLGDVTAASAVIEGEVAGARLEADRIEIGATGRVRASVRARVIAVAEGAVLEGDVDMGGPAPTSFREKRGAGSPGSDPADP